MIFVFKELAKDLVNNKIHVYAIGISSSTSATFLLVCENLVNFGGGYQLESSDELAEGKFTHMKVVRKLSAYNVRDSVFTIFTTVDSSGTELVMLNSKCINVVNLEIGISAPIKVKGDDAIASCISPQFGKAYLSSNEPGTFYSFDGYLGNFSKITFSDARNVPSSTLCMREFLGFLCQYTDEGENVVLRKGESCPASAPRNVQSGVVGDASIVLLTILNEVYYFNKSVLDGAAVKMHKTDPADAWSQVLSTSSKCENKMKRSSNH